MKFGYSYSEKNQGHVWFAWFPVKLETGQWIWFENVKRIRNQTYLYEWIYGKKTYVGDEYNWEYNLI